MKLKLEIEIDISDKAGHDFVDSIHDNFKQGALGNQVIGRLAEYSRERPISIKTCSYFNDRKPVYGNSIRPILFTEDKHVIITLTS